MVDSFEFEVIIKEEWFKPKDFNPRFLRRYCDMHTEMTSAVQAYIKDVKSSDFPNEKEQY